MKGNNMSNELRKALAKEGLHGKLADAAIAATAHLVRTPAEPDVLRLRNALKILLRDVGPITALAREQAPKMPSKTLWAADIVTFEVALENAYRTLAATKPKEVMVDTGALRKNMESGDYDD